MATEQELKKLNKTVDEAVNMLKMYIGNSAQVKNMNEKQREAISKWFDVVETEEDNQNKQRAFTERARDASGKFLKKQEDMSMNFLGIAKSIGGIFKGMSESITSSISSLVSGIGSRLSDLFGKISSGFIGLFGEESQWFEVLGSIKNTIGGIVGWAFKGFMKLFKTPKWATSMLDWLEKMYGLQVKEFKMGFLGDSKKKQKTPWAIVGGLIFLAAAVFGAWLAARLKLVTEVLSKFKIGNLFTKIGNWFKLKFPKLTIGFKKFTTGLSKLGKWLLKAPILGKILRGLRFGMKYLAWPLTILFGIFDFIKGWKETTGDWQAKLMGGLKGVMSGLLELPLEILGWAFDQITGFFGIETTGTADKLKKWFDDIMDWMLKFGPIGIITDIIKGFQTGDWIGLIEKRLEDTFGWIPGMTEWIKSLMTDTPKTIDQPSSIDTHLYTERQKIGLENLRQRRLKNAVDANTKQTKKSALDTKNTITNLQNQNNNNNGGGTVETQQIPDELDSTIIAVKNYGGDFD